VSEQFYLYKFEDATRTYSFTNVAHVLNYDGLEYLPVTISHTQPTFSSDPSQARVTVSLRDDLQVAMNYISHPPPWKTAVEILEVLETEVNGNTLDVTHVEPHWSGRIARIAWRDSFRAVEMTCRTQQEIHFSRETLNEGLGPLCRFHTGDGRCPVNIENFKEPATVVAVSGDISEPTITVSGLAQSDSYYKAGMIRLADSDWRTVAKALTSGGNKILTLSRAFPATAVQNGDTVDVFAGDDLTQETCSVIFGAETDSGAAWGGWNLTPNRDYQRYGIRAQQ
jgi:hypothetical protein